MTAPEIGGQNSLLCGLHRLRRQHARFAVPEYVHPFAAAQPLQPASRTFHREILTDLTLETTSDVPPRTRQPRKVFIAFIQAFGRSDRPLFLTNALKRESDIVVYRG